GPYRVSDYTRDLAGVLAQANTRQMLWVQIEHADALANLNEIIAVPGIDAFFIGQGDLSQSLGHLANVDHPRVAEPARAAVAAIRKAGVPTGSAFGANGDWGAWHDAGLRIFTVGADF